MESANNPGQVGRKSSWPRKLLIAAAIGAVLLGAAYFVVTSAAFIKGVVLPRVGQSLGAEITVQEATLRPFSEVALRKFSLKTTGTEPLVSADEVRIRYNLRAILAGTIEVHELTLTAPVVRIVQEPDGRSNLDPLLGTPDQSSPPAASEPLKVAIQNLSVKNGQVRMLARDKSGATLTTELNELNLSVDRIQNGQPGKLTLAMVLGVVQAAAPGVPGTNDVLQARLNGAFDYTIDPSLKPRELKGNARMDFTRTEGAYADLAGLGANLEADLTPTELREAALRFERGGQRLGQVLVSGPFDLEKAEARVKIEVQSIDRNVLNVVGAAHGIDFGTSTFNATSTLDLSRDWKLISVNGRLTGGQVSLKQAGQSTPTLEMSVEYDAQINLERESAVIQKLTILGRCNQNDLLTASLDKPMNVTWAEKAQGFAESTLQLALKQFDLSEWRPVLGADAPSGVVDMQLAVLAQNDAKQLTTKLSATIKDLDAQVGTNRIQHATVKVDGEAFLEEFRNVNLRALEFAIQQKDKPLINGKGSGTYDTTMKQGAMQISAEATLPTVLDQMPMPDLNASLGTVKLSSSLTLKENKHSATGTVSLNDFTGRFADYSFTRFQAALDYNLDLTDNILQLYRATISLQQGLEKGGSLDLSGKVNLTNNAAQITFKATELNQTAMRPFLAPSLGDKKLVSISFNGNGTAGYDPAGESALKGDFNISNWVVQDPQQATPQPPLGVRLQLDGSLRQELLDLRECIVSLSPTDRANNQIQLKAKLNLNPTNSTPSQISLAAESIDVTPFYDLFAGATNAAPETVTAPPSNAPQTEPDPVTLPFADLTAGVKIDRFYLREIAISNLLTTVKIQKSKVDVKPLQMTLNGAPVSATAALNLGVPGYVYDVGFQADRVPVAPLANSFSTNQSDFFQGDLIASGQIKGAGVTGVNLQKNLAGQANLSITNMNLEIVGRKTRRLLEPIALVLGINEVLQSPLTGIEARTQMGQGQITLNKFGVLSSAFYAESQGTIPIADVLTNSPLNLPVNLALRRSLAEKANLMPADAPTNTAYVALPPFVKLTGTIGDPKTQTDKLVIAGMLARTATRFIPNATGKVGNIVEGVGNLLSGQGAKVDAPTNAPPTATQPTSPAAELLQGIGNLLGRPRPKPADTNAAPEKP